MIRRTPRTDLLLVAMGAPHQGELVTSLLRVVRATLRKERTVQVWTCGYATQLTQRSLTDYKPTDLLDRHRRDPSTAALIGGLIAEHPERLYWFGCRTCSEQRGATDHIDAVSPRAPHRFAEHVAAARATVYLGTS